MNPAGRVHFGDGSVADERVRVVTIMNYPPEERTRRMCYAFLDSVIAGGAESVTVFYEDHKPEVAPEHRAAIDIEVRPGTPVDVGHPHFNLRFKLPTLANLTEPFLYLDADTYVLGDLREVWAARRDKPWVGVNHQWVPSDARTHRPPFLNSGVQLVGDPSFYDLGAILAVQNAAAPLWESDLSLREDPKTYICPGRDQAVLFRYFTAVGYDYTHPVVNSPWNCCAGVASIRRDGDGWAADSAGLDPPFAVKLLHYWDQFKPWRTADPIFASYAGRVG